MILTLQEYSKDLSKQADAYIKCFAQRLACSKYPANGSFPHLSFAYSDHVLCLGSTCLYDLCVCALKCTRMHLCLYVGASVKLFKMERSSDHSCSSEMDFQFFHGKDGGR